MRQGNLFTDYAVLIEEEQVEIVAEANDAGLLVEIKEEPPPEASPEPAVLSVSDLNKQIRSVVEGQFPLIWVQGEISNFVAHRSGHFYFSLKDKTSQIKAVMFKGFNNKMKFKPENGMEVLVRGKISVYEPRGDYQLFCEVLEPVGAGALQKEFEQLKAKLKLEGLFEESRKRKIPILPKHIAIITSPTGAAIRDILNVLNRRNRSVRVTLIPALVQGDGAAVSVCAAFAKIARCDGVDVVIIGRGGGSIEDLWCFNDEKLARLIAASPIPVISAVGHEIDFTIADFVADLRAPTPSAAAELVVKNAEELHHRVNQMKRGLIRLMLSRLGLSKERTNSLTKRLADPKRRLQDLSQRNDELYTRLGAAQVRYLKQKQQQIGWIRSKLGRPDTLIKQFVERIEQQRHRLARAMDKIQSRKQQKLEMQMGILDSLSPLRVVDRGYSLSFKDKKIIRSSESIQPGDKLKLIFAKGQASVEVIETQQEAEVPWTSKRNSAD